MASGTDLACCPDTNIAQYVPKKRWNWLELGVMLFGGREGAVQQRAPVEGGVRACFAVPLN